MATVFDTLAAQGATPYSSYGQMTHNINPYGQAYTVDSEGTGAYPGLTFNPNVDNWGQPLFGTGGQLSGVNGTPYGTVDIGGTMFRQMNDAPGMWSPGWESFGPEPYYHPQYGWLWPEESAGARAKDLNSQDDFFTKFLDSGGGVFGLMAPIGLAALGMGPLAGASIMPGSGTSIFGGSALFGGQPTFTGGTPFDYSFDGTGIAPGSGVAGSTIGGGALQGVDGSLYNSMFQIPSEYGGFGALNYSVPFADMAGLSMNTLGSGGAVGGAGLAGAPLSGLSFGDLGFAAGSGITQGASTMEELLRLLKTSGMMPGGTVGNLFNIGRGIYGLSQASDLRKLAEQAAAQQDPFGPHRGQYAQMLSQLYADPSRIQQMPGYEAGLDAVTRKMAQQGYLGSGNMMSALQKYGGDFFNAEAARLAQLAGAQFGPSGGNLLLQGNMGATQLAGNALSSLGYGGLGLLGNALDKLWMS